jgi:hypothetical protein
LKKYKKFFFALLVTGVALNTVMLFYNIVAEAHGTALINFFSGLCLLIAYEVGRMKNDEQ